MEFLQQISDFISITVYERKEKIREQTLLKSLNLVIDKMDRGVIILNQSNMVTHINRKAIEILNFADSNFKHSINLEEMPESVLGMKEYQLSIGGRAFYVAGSLNSMGLNDSQFDRMLIFQDYRNLKQVVSGFSDVNRDVRCEDILGDSEQMMELKQNIRRVALSRSTVLITGESGTGKEMFAMAIHNEGNRKDGPFIAINCAAIPYELLESELFGYVKGAFTGASSTGKMGKFELANNGTIFLDEIGDMPLSLQIKLLRVLQDKRIVRIGSNKPIDVDVRVIAATNKDLVKLIEENKFREDLFYRLNVLPFSIPPLRERILDINVMVNYFIEKYMKLLNKRFSSVRIDSRVWEVFYGYPWPGNVRELENTIEFMINMIDNDGIFTADIIPRNILGNERKNMERADEVRNLKYIEKDEIEKALKKYGNDTMGKKIAAQKLGIGIATLYRKIDEYELSK
jgi:transcriptional regulator with PAS, ATPase and Fis domain